MCFDERWTDRRGRSPASRFSSLRTRRLRRSNWLSLRSMARSSLLLAFLAEDVLALVADTLALVGLRRTRGAQFRRELAYLLLVDARDGDDLLLGAADLHVHAGRHLVDDVVAEANLQLDVLALHRRAEADAVNLERLRVSFGDTLDQVHDLGARHAPHGAGLLGVLGEADLDAGPGLGDLDPVRTGEGEFALRPLHRHFLAGNGRGYPRWNRHRLFAYPRHDRSVAFCLKVQALRSKDAAKN